MRPGIITWGGGRVPGRPPPPLEPPAQRGASPFGAAGRQPPVRSGGVSAGPSGQPQGPPQSVQQAGARGSGEARQRQGSAGPEQRSRRPRPADRRSLQAPLGDRAVLPLGQANLENPP